MRIKISLFKDKVLLYAILLSAVWHVFWLSSVSVVVVPKQAKQVKFSGVSFLGAMPDRSPIRVSAVPHERTAPEKRYLADIGALSARMAAVSARDSYTDAGLGDEALPADDEGLDSLAIAAIDTQKLEPGRDFD